MCVSVPQVLNTLLTHDVDECFSSVDHFMVKIKLVAFVLSHCRVVMSSACTRAACFTYTVGRP